MNEDLERMLTNVAREEGLRCKAVESRPVFLPQGRITYGTYWISPHSLEPLETTWGYVLPLRELLAMRLRAGDTPEELEQYMSYEHSRHLAGWRASLEYCAHGCTMVSRHVTELWPVRSSEFVLAKVESFDNALVNRHPWIRKLVLRVRAEMKAAQQQTSLSDPGNVMMEVIDDD